MPVIQPPKLCQPIKFKETLNSHKIYHHIKSLKTLTGTLECTKGKNNIKVWFLKILLDIRAFFVKI